MYSKNWRVKMTKRFNDYEKAMEFISEVREVTAEQTFIPIGMGGIEIHGLHDDRIDVGYHVVRFHIELMADDQKEAKLMVMNLMPGVKWDEMYLSAQWGRGEGWDLKNDVEMPTLFERESVVEIRDMAKEAHIVGSYELYEGWNIDIRIGRNRDGKDFYNVYMAVFPTGDYIYMGGGSEEYYSRLMNRVKRTVETIKANGQEGWNYHPGIDAKKFYIQKTWYDARGEGPTLLEREAKAGKLYSLWYEAPKGDRQYGGYTEPMNKTEWTPIVEQVFEESAGASDAWSEEDMRNVDFNDKVDYLRSIGCFVDEHEGKVTETSPRWNIPAPTLLEREADAVKRFEFVLKKNLGVAVEREEALNQINAETEYFKVANFSMKVNGYLAGKGWHDENNYRLLHATTLGTHEVWVRMDFDIKAEDKKGAIDFVKNVLFDDAMWNKLGWTNMEIDGEEVGIERPTLLEREATIDKEAEKGLYEVVFWKAYKTPQEANVGLEKKKAEIGNRNQDVNWELSTGDEQEAMLVILRVYGIKAYSSKDASDYVVRNFGTGWDDGNWHQEGRPGWSVVWTNKPMTLLEREGSEKWRGEELKLGDRVFLMDNIEERSNGVIEKLLANGYAVVRFGDGKKGTYHINRLKKDPTLLEREAKATAQWMLKLNVEAKSPEEADEIGETIKERLQDPVFEGMDRRVWVIGGTNWQGSPANVNPSVDWDSGWFKAKYPPDEKLSGKLEHMIEVLGFPRKNFDVDYMRGNYVSGWDLEHATEKGKTLLEREGSLFEREAIVEIRDMTKESCLVG